MLETLLEKQEGYRNTYNNKDLEGRVFCSTEELKQVLIYLLCKQEILLNIRIEKTKLLWKIPKLQRSFIKRNQKTFRDLIFIKNFVQ